MAETGSDRPDSADGSARPAATVRGRPSIPARLCGTNLRDPPPGRGGLFWKDLMVNIVQEVETAQEKASIDLDSRGEMKPVSNSLTR